MLHKKPKNNLLRRLISLLILLFLVFPQELLAEAVYSYRLYPSWSSLLLLTALAGLLVAPLLPPVKPGKRKRKGKGKKRFWKRPRRKKLKEGAFLAIIFIILGISLLFLLMGIFFPFGTSIASTIIFLAIIFGTFYIAFLAILAIGDWFSWEAAGIGFIVAFCLFIAITAALLIPFFSLIWEILLILGISIGALYLGFLFIYLIAGGIDPGLAALGGFVVAITLFGWAFGGLILFSFASIWLSYAVFAGMVVLGAGAALLLSLIAVGEVTDEFAGGVAIIAFILLLLALIIVGIILLLAVLPLWLQITILVLLIAGVYIGWYFLTNY